MLGAGGIGMFERISFDANIMGGRACIRGMRIPVSLVVNLVANGMTASEIVSEYPDLEEADVRAALQYAAVLTSDEVYELPIHEISSRLVPGARA